VNLTLKRLWRAGAAAAVAFCAWPGTSSGAVSSSHNGSDLLIASDGASDTIAVTCVLNSVKVNGGDPGSGPLACSATERIDADGLEGNDAFDLSGVTAAAGFTPPVVTNVYGGPGDDTLIASPMGDFFFGDGFYSQDPAEDFGDDELVGGAGNDLFAGYGGSDRADGAGGDDDLFGGVSSPPLDPKQDNNDVLRGGRGDDQLIGLEGDDRLDGGPGDEGFAQLRGGGGDDRVNGGEGRDEVWGEDGDDVVTGGSGVDRMDGGRGSDKLNAADNRVDADTDCGRGEDSALVDDRAPEKFDAKLACERVRAR
jgi:Ca2+-binding RTX toxin-like protein